ncbi:thioesterase family protein [Pseudomonas corrugata]
MNLFLRLFIMSLAGAVMRWRKPTSFRNATAIGFIAAPLDIDLNMHINNGRFLSLADLGRLHFLWSVGTLGGILKNGWMPLVGNVDIEYRKSIKLFQRFEIKTELLYWDEKWFYFQHVFMVGSKVSAVANVKALLIDRSRKIVDPARIFALIGESPEPPAVPESIADWVVRPRAQSQTATPLQSKALESQSE